MITFAYPVPFNVIITQSSTSKIVTTFYNGPFPQILKTRLRLDSPEYLTYDQLKHTLFLHGKDENPRFIELQGHLWWTLRIVAEPEPTLSVPVPYTMSISDELDKQLDQSIKEHYGKENVQGPYCNCPVPCTFSLS
tara:strand:+ start:3005 stop:3412 length:408 start_codon:yes stop_codon:yes gene_type:complete